jgi:hypothetical protein
MRRNAPAQRQRLPAETERKMRSVTCSLAESGERASPNCKSRSCAVSRVPMRRFLAASRMAPPPTAVTRSRNDCSMSTLRLTSACHEQTAVATSAPAKTEGSKENRTWTHANGDHNSLPGRQRRPRGDVGTEPGEHDRRCCDRSGPQCGQRPSQGEDEGSEAHGRRVDKGRRAGERRRLLGRRSESAADEREGR